jgi:hypothetical protein
MCARPLDVAYRPLFPAWQGDLTDFTEERGAGVLGVAVLPEQFYPSSVAHTPGMRALMRAVLNDAIMCYQKRFVSQSRRAHRLAREAEAWLFCNDDRWPFSFVNICGALGIEPAILRRRLRQWGQGVPTPLQRQRRRLKPDHRLLLAA